MPETDDDLPVFEAAANVQFGVVGVVVSALDLESHLVGSAVSTATQRTDGATDRRIEIGARPGDRACGKSRGIELMLGIENQRLVETTGLQCRRGLAPQEVQEVCGDRVVIGLGFDAPAVVRPVIPVEQHRPEAGDQPIRNLARGTRVMVLRFGKNRAESRAAAAQDVHGMCGSGQVLEHRSEHHRQTTQGLEFLLVLIELRRTRQAPVKQQVRHLLEGGILGQSRHIVPTVVQIVARTPDRTDRRIAGNHTGQRNPFLGPG